MQRWKMSDSRLYPRNLVMMNNMEDIHVSSVWSLQFFISLILYQLKYAASIYHNLYPLYLYSCMSSPLAPDPIRVQSWVCCLLWTNEIVRRKHISLYLSYYPIRDMNPSIGAISKWKYLLLLKHSAFCRYIRSVNNIESVLNCLY